jgi:DNA recombination-dependent growth factor C
MQEKINIIKKLLPKAFVKARNAETLIVSPNGFFSPQRIQQMADSIKGALPDAKDVYVGQGGVVEGLIVVKF